MLLQPAVSNVADFYEWKTTQTIASNSVANNANKATAQFQIQPNSFFCFMAWRGVTNYDNIAGQFESANVSTALSSRATVPSFFEVKVIRDNDYNMMPIPMPQGAIASYGYAAGAQLPWPILYSPMSRFNFEFYNTSPVLLQDNDGTAIPLRIDFGMFGYNVASENIGTFLKSWPSLWNVFKSYPNLADALACLSSQDFSNIVPGV